MSKEQPTKLSIDPTSIINLKAELLKKQEEFRLKKLAQSKTPVDTEYEASKTVSTWGKKKIKAKEELEKKAERETSVEPEETEEDVLKKSRKMLESKARFYEQVASGQKLPEEGDEEIFLVNFDQKIVEKKTEEENEIEKAKLKFKTEVIEQDYNEQLRSKWEKEKYENIEKMNIRYEDVRYDEIRNLGVGNFRFSKDETEREKQMEFFKNLHLETQTNRIQNEINNLKREKQLKERLNKIKQRRLLKHGYSLAEIKELCPYDKEIEVIDEEIKELEELVKDPELINARLEQKEKQQEETEEFDAVRMKKKISFDREWDKPKLKEKFWEKHVQKLRSERQKQFAPPESYVKKQAKSKKKKPKEPQKERETEPITVEPKQTEANSSYQYSADQFSYFYPPPPSHYFPPSSFIPFPNINIPPPNFQFQQANFGDKQNNA